ncbi:hypothetical protein QTP86_014579 [Hemibagrus guttatus]|nr:hypothetical protein QTP86_014579 [Hemibagrus guttatus]
MGLVFYPLPVHGDVPPFGAKNGKANALSRRFETASNPVLVEPILPATAILAPVRWNLVEEIQRSHADDPPPAGCPPTKIFVPPPFRLQSNGQAERLNQEIGRFLRSYCSREQQQWSEFLPWAEYAQNSLIHSSTGLTPFQCVLGYQPPLFPWSGEPSDVPAVEEWYQRSQEVWERAHVRLQRAVRSQRIQADRRRRPHPSYQVGQRVWLSTRNLHLKLPCRKLNPRFIGPFEIIRKVTPEGASAAAPPAASICPTVTCPLLPGPADPFGLRGTGGVRGRHPQPWTSGVPRHREHAPATPGGPVLDPRTSWTGGGLDGLVQGGPPLRSQTPPQELLPSRRLQKSPHHFRGRRGRDFLGDYPRGGFPSLERGHIFRVLVHASLMAFEDENYIERPASPACDSDASLPDALNSFNARFEAQNDITARKTISPPEDQVLCLTMADVRKTLCRVKPRKAAGSNNIPGRVLRECAEQLADVFTDIFSISLSSAIIPTCLKTTTIIPVPKKSSVSCLNDFRPIALKPIIMKCFERLVMRHIKNLLPPSLDPMQFAYRPNRSMDDTIITTLHLSLTHLDVIQDGAADGSHGVLVRSTFPCFVLLFSFVPQFCLLQDFSHRPSPQKTKITGLNDYRPVALTSVVMKSFEHLVLSYLKDITDPLLDPLWFTYSANRSVDDAVNMALHFIFQHLDSPGSYARILFVDFSSAFNTIVPALLRDKLFQLNVPDSMRSWITDILTDSRQFMRLGTHVSDFQHTSTGSPKAFADDTTFIGLISDGDKLAYRGEMDCLVSWCSMNNLELNSLKTVDMIVDFRKDPAPLPPVILCDSPVTSVESFHFLGTTITQELKWEQNISSLTKKAQQRMYFQRQLKKFLLPVKMLVNFYTAIIESILTFSITVWFAAATARDKAKLQCVIHSAEKVISCSLPSLQELSRSRRSAAKITAEPSHPGNELFQSFPSGKRLRSIRTRTSCHKNSFFPTAVSLLNNTCLLMLFIDFSSAFNTIIPQHLTEKLSLLGINISLCNWILDFLTGRPQSVRIGNSILSTTTLNTGASQGCVLSPLLFTLLTHNCAAMHSSNHIIKCADDTTVVGLISKNDESAYREKAQRLTDWCKANNLSLNVEKMKEMVVDFRRTQSDHSTLNIDGSNVETVKSTKFLGIHLAEDLAWSLNTTSITKKSQQHLYFLRRLRKAHLLPPILTTFYRGTIESILSSCITALFGNCTVSDRKSLQRMVRTAEKIIRVTLPSITDIYTTCCIQKANNTQPD